MVHDRERPIKSRPQAFEEEADTVLAFCVLCYTTATFLESINHMS